MAMNTSSMPMRPSRPSWHEMTARRSFPAQTLSRPTWAPATVFVYRAKKTISWRAIYAIGAALFALAVLFTVLLLLRPIPVPHY